MILPYPGVALPGHPVFALPSFFCTAFGALDNQTHHLIQAHQLINNMNRKTLFLVLLFIMAAVVAAVPNSGAVKLPRASTAECSYCMKSCSACKKKRSDGLDSGPLEKLEERQVDLAHWVRYLSRLLTSVEFLLVLCTSLLFCQDYHQD
jgi:hypothetical protein